MPSDEPLVHLRRPSQWPLLLVGPIVRKVTRDKAHILIGTKEACKAQILVAQGYKRHDEIPNGDVQNEKRLRRIGHNLFVGLLEVDLIDAEADSPFSYDIQLRLLGDVDANTNDGPPLRLNDFGLLGNPHDAANPTLEEHLPLGYAPDILPSFLTPPQNVLSLRLAHASCRKPHGNPDSEYEPDALPILDDVISRSLSETAPGPADSTRTWLDAEGTVVETAPVFPPDDQGHKLAERPHQLIMTGDQIYADDVSPALLDALIQASSDLLGWDEEPPGITQDINGFLVQPGWRSRYLVMSGVKEEPKAGKPSYDQSHLLRFGEWCAMYLMAWSPALWPRTADESKVTLRASGHILPVSKIVGALEFYQDLPTTKAREQATLPLTFLFDKAKSKVINHLVLAEEAENARKNLWEKYRKPAIQYGSTVPYVRRLLANTPTYMMFDDHEITDDWFVSSDVADRLLGYVPADGEFSNPPPSAFWGRNVGPRILRNGLSAYAIFQHWGNVPTDFDGWDVATPAGTTPSVGVQLLELWEPNQTGTELGEVNRSVLAGATYNPTATSEAFWWADRNAAESTVTTEVKTSWMSWDFSPDPNTRLADSLLRIDGYSTDANGEYPGTGDPSQRDSFNHFRWDYAIEFDSHRLIVLDTRTWRHFPQDASSAVLVGTSVSTDVFAARTVTAPVLATFALAWNGATNPATAALGAVMTACVDLLNEDAPDEVGDRLSDLGGSLTGFVNLVMAGSSRKSDADFAINTLFLELNGTAEFTTRPALVTVLDHWVRAGAILREVGGMRAENFVEIYNSAANELLTPLGEYFEELGQGSEISALTALRRFINTAADLATNNVDPVKPSAGRLQVIQAAQVAASGTLSTLLAGIGIHAGSEDFFRNGKGYLAPELIAAPALDWMVTTPIANTGAGKETVLLSPAPIFGVDAVETLQRVGVLAGTVAGDAAAEEYDYEAWSANPVGFDNFLVAAKGLDHAVVLSGDVHYGFSSENRVTLPREEVDTTFLQFTASASKNSDGTTKMLGQWGWLIWSESTQFDIHQFSPVALFRRGWDFFETDDIPNDNAPPVTKTERFVGWLGEALRAKLSDYSVEYHFDDMRLMMQEYYAIENPKDYLAWHTRWFLNPAYNEAKGKFLDMVNNPDRYAEGAWDYISTAPINTFNAFKNETLWMMINNVNRMVGALDDPVKWAFGHRLYSRDVLTKITSDIYKSLAVDPAYGFRINARSLVDVQGKARLMNYGARYRFDGDNEPKTMMYGNEQEANIVGSATIGLVRFVNNPDIGLGARHDLLFYPVPSHPGTVTPPAGPLGTGNVTQPDPGEVTAYRAPRYDWMSTRHMGLFGRPDSLHVTGNGDV